MNQKNFALKLVVPERQISRKEIVPAIQSELHPSLNQQLEGQPKDVVRACLLMVGYLCAMDGKTAENVQTQDLVDPRLEKFIVSQATNAEKKSILTGARKLMRILGERTMFPKTKYAMQHPALSEWLEELARTHPRVKNWGTDCMYFLTWLHEKDFHHYRPHEMRLSLTSRKHLLEFRFYLLKRIDRHEINHNSARAQLYHVIRWIRWLIQHGKMTTIDTSGITISPIRPRERRLPSHSEIQRLLEKLSTKRRWLPYLFYVLLLGPTGARPGEIEWMTIEDVIVPSQTLHLASKNGLERYISLTDSLWARLQWYIKEFRSDAAPTDRLLVQQNGLPLKYATIRYNVYKAAAEIQIRIDGLHVFRHVFATDCMNNRVDLNVTRTLLGHIHMVSLDPYEHPSGQQDDLIRNVLSNSPWSREEL